MLFFGGGGNMKVFKLLLVSFRSRLVFFFSDSSIISNMVAFDPQPTVRNTYLSCQVVSNSLRSHELQHTRLPCPSLAPRVCSNLCPLSQWCHPTISSSATPFFYCLQSSPASGSLKVSWLFTSHSQSTGASASASVLPMNIQGWFPSGLTGLISLLFKGLLRVFSSTTIWKH